MDYSTGPRWVGPQNISLFFSTISDGRAAVTAAPLKTRFSASKSTLHALGGARCGRTPFDFSVFQRQHEETTWTLATFSSGDGATADAGGGAVVAVDTAATSRSTYLDDLPLSPWVQTQQREKQQEQKMLRVRPCLGALRPRLVVGPGQFGGQVGLLGALQPPELTKYLTAKERGLPKPSRAPRTNLSHLTQKEKVDHHREQVRLSSQRKRKQAMLLEAGLEQEVAQMRTYKEAIDMAPFVMVVLSAHINNCRVLYVNKPVTEKLGHEVVNLFGRSFFMMVHPQDRAHLASVLNECIRTSQPHHGRVLCRFWCTKGAGNNQQPFKQMDMSVNIGTKGLICNLWEVRDRH